MKREVAFGLADAMLAGPPTPASARARCTKALGRNWPWLAGLAKTIVKQYALEWHTGSREGLAHSILALPEFHQAWAGEHRPELRYYFLPPLALSPRPFALAQCALPDLPTCGRIAEWLGLELRELDWFADANGWNTHATDEKLRHYLYRWMEKRSGGHRLLEIPKSRLRRLQQRILRGLLEYVPPHEAAHGFRARHSCVTNAAPHVAAENRDPDGSAGFLRQHRWRAGVCDVPDAGLSEGSRAGVDRPLHQPCSSAGIPGPRSDEV